MPPSKSRIVSALSPTLRRFGRSRAGNVGIVFGLAVTPLVLAAGAAVDYSRASDLQTSLQAGTDATTLVLCKASPTLTDAELTTLAQTGVQGYVTGGTVAVDGLKVSNSPRNVVLKTTSSYQTAFMKIMNRDTVAVAASAACSASEQYFEIALVLDTTGSMAYTGGTQTKMEAAKTAAKTFVDYMYTTGALPGHVRMSLVPFAASVAIPTAFRTASWLDTTALSPIHWQYVTNPGGSNFTSRLSIYNKLDNTNADWAWAGCVESPPYPYNVQDDAVSTATPSSMIVPMFAPDEVSSRASFRNDGNTYYYQDANNANSYIDDGSEFGTGSCRSDDSSQSKRFTQACKYRARDNARSSMPGPNWGCTSRPLSLLGTAQATIKSEITALRPDGSTNVHEGFMWGWRTISPTSVFSGQSSPPVAYGTLNYNKIIVLMTDGTNQWLSNSDVIGKSYYSAYGYFRNADGTDATTTNSRLKPGRSNLSTSDHGRAAIDELLAVACTNAKAKGVQIYTVGFSTPTDPIDAQGLSLLSNCATASDYAFVANDANAVISAFQKIAQGIGQLRITR